MGGVNTGALGLKMTMYLSILVFKKVLNGFLKEVTTERNVEDEEQLHGYTCGGEDHERLTDGY